MLVFPTITKINKKLILLVHMYLIVVYIKIIICSSLNKLVFPHYYSNSILKTV